MTVPNYATLNAQLLNQRAAEIRSHHRIPWTPGQEVAALALVRHALQRGVLQTPTIEEPMGLDHNSAHPRHAATSASAGRLTGRGRRRRAGGGRSTCASTCSNSAGCGRPKKRSAAVVPSGR